MKLKFINLILILLFSGFIIYHSSQPVLANQLIATDSTSESKLKSLELDIASKASLLKDEISKKLQNKAYVGTLKSKDALAIQINSNFGTLNAKFNEFTQFSGKKVSTVDSLTVGDNVAALGDVDENGVMNARAIVKISSAPIVKISIWGTVIENDAQGVVVQTKEGKKYNIDTDSDTDIHSDSGSLDLNKLKNNLALIVSGIKIGDDKIQATLIYIPPTTTDIKTNNGATNSATASPSAASKK